MSAEDSGRYSQKYLPLLSFDLSFTPYAKAHRTQQDT